MSERLIVVSTDCHAGLPIADYKPYVESKYHEVMDMAVPVQVEMMDQASLGRDTLRIQFSPVRPWDRCPVRNTANIVNRTGLIDKGLTVVTDLE